jgi:hypothetical protein
MIFVLGEVIVSTETGKKSALIAVEIFEEV